jgi:hypothetical protein
MRNSLHLAKSALALSVTVAQLQASNEASAVAAGWLVLESQAIKQAATPKNKNIFFIVMI